MEILELGLGFIGVVAYLLVLFFFIFQIFKMIYKTIKEDGFLGLIKQIGVGLVLIGVVSIVFILAACIIGAVIKAVLCLSHLV